MTRAPSVRTPRRASTRCPPTSLRRLATRLVARLDPGHDERLARDERLQHEQRHLDVTPLDGGTVAVRGLLTRGTGHALIALLDAHSAPAPAADGAPDPRSATQRRHDALGHLVDGGLLASGSRHGAPVRLVVTVPLDRLRGEAGAEAATIGEGVPVSDRLLGEPGLRRRRRAGAARPRGRAARRRPHRTALHRLAAPGARGARRPLHLGRLHREARLVPRPPPGRLAARRRDRPRQRGAALQPAPPPRPPGSGSPGSSRPAPSSGPPARHPA
nr:DUF222 domain-containing protein [Angustibacter aerolatus]